MNTDLYEFVALVLQASQALNITLPGGQKYNVPTTNITVNFTGDATPTLFSYSQQAIAGADDFLDDDVKIKDVFDAVVSNTREVTPTCKFPVIRSHLLISPTYLQSSWNHLVTRVRTKAIIHLRYFLTIPPQL